MPPVAMGSVVGVRGSCDCAQDDGQGVRAVTVILRAVAGVRRFARRVILRTVAGVRHSVPRVILRAIAGSTPAKAASSIASAI